MKRAVICAVFISFWGFCGPTPGVCANAVDAPGACNLQLDGLSQDIASPGTAVSLYGWWGEEQGPKIVSLNRAGLNPVKVLSWTSAEIEIRIPKSLLSGIYQVRVYCGDPKTSIVDSTVGLDLVITQTVPAGLVRRPPFRKDRNVPSSSTGLPFGHDPLVEPESKIQLRLAKLKRFEKVKPLPKNEVSGIAYDFASSDERVSRAAYEILKYQFPQFPEEAVPLIAPVLASPNREMRLHAAMLLGGLFPMPPHVVENFLHLLEGPDMQLQLYVMGPLSRMAAPEKRFIAAMKKMMESGDDTWRRAAVDALGNTERQRLLFRGMRQWKGVNYSHPVKIVLAVNHPLSPEQLASAFRKQFPLPIWWNKETPAQSLPQEATALKSHCAKFAGALHPCFRAGMEMILSHPERVNSVFDGLELMRSGDRYYPWLPAAEELVISQFLARREGSADANRLMGERLGQIAVNRAKEQNDLWDFERTIDLVDEVLSIRKTELRQEDLRELMKLQAIALYNTHNRVRAQQVISNAEADFPTESTAEFRALRVLYEGPAADTMDRRGEKWLDHQSSLSYSPVQGKGRWPPDPMPDFVSFLGESIPRISRMIGGRKTLLYFFQRRCEECRAKRLQLAPLAKALKSEGWQIFALEYMGHREPPADDRRQFPDEIFLADENINVPPALGISEFTVMTIGPEGRIRYRGGVDGKSIRSTMKDSVEPLQLEFGYQVGNRLKDFKLPDAKGNEHSLYKILKGRRAVLFPIQPKAPIFNKQILPSIRVLAPTLRKHGVLLIGIQGADFADPKAVQLFDAIMVDQSEETIQQLHLTGALVVDEKGVIQQNDIYMGPARVYESAKIDASK